MDEMPKLELTPKQVQLDKIGVFAVSGIASFVASTLAEKGYKALVTAYRLKKAAA